MTAYTRRDVLSLAAATGALIAFDRRASAAGFDWNRLSGTELRFMLSVHPWTA